MKSECWLRDGISDNYQLIEILISSNLYSSCNAAVIVRLSHVCNFFLIVTGKWHASIYSDFGYLSEPLVVSFALIVFSNGNVLLMLYVYNSVIHQVNFLSEFEFGILLLYLYFRFGIFNPTVVYDHLGEIYSTLIFGSLVFCVLLYIKVRIGNLANS